MRTGPNASDYNYINENAAFTIGRIDPIKNNITTTQVPRRRLSLLYEVWSPCQLIRYNKLQSKIAELCKA